MPLALCDYTFVCPIRGSDTGTVLPLETDRRFQVPFDEPRLPHPATCGRLCLARSEPKDTELLVRSHSKIGDVIQCFEKRPHGGIQMLFSGPYAPYALVITRNEPRLFWLVLSQLKLAVEAKEKGSGFANHFPFLLTCW